MTAAPILLGLTLVSYLSGSIPFGLLVGLAKGVDPRKAGSGNIGATNVGRLLGARYFALVFTLDLLKAMLPSLAAGIAIGFKAADWKDYLLWLLVGFAAIVGHMFSLFLKFKGGKGIASSAGAFLGIWPYLTLPTLVVAAIWGVTFKMTRYISLASLIAVAAFPVAYLLLGLRAGWPVVGAQLPFLIATLLLVALVFYKHRGNIARLRAGTELLRRPTENQPAGMMNPGRLENSHWIEQTAYFAV